MPAEEIYRSALGIDLSPRIVTSVTVAASPAAAAETTIASLSLPANAAVATGIVLLGWAALTVGTTGASVRLRIRQTSTAGTLVADSGAVTGGVAAAALVTQDAGGLDSAPVLPGQVYVLTLTVGSATAASTVSAVQLLAVIV